MSEHRTCEHLVEIFRGHGLSCTLYDDWVVPNSQPPAIRAVWSPGPRYGRLDIQVFIRENVVILESFAGVGEGEDAFHDALLNFSANSLHVLLAALWNVDVPEQVTTDRWKIGGRTWVAYIGNFGLRAFDGEAPTIPDGLFASIEAAIKRETLTDDTHWFRFYVGGNTEHFEIESLKDNEPWEPGRRCIQSAGWKKTREFRSVRLFLCLRADAESRR